MYSIHGAVAVFWTRHAGDSTKPGLLIANGFLYTVSGHYWISKYPGIALLITIVPINLVGD